MNQFWQRSSIEKIPVSRLCFAYKYGFQASSCRHLLTSTKQNGTHLHLNEKLTTQSPLSIWQNSRIPLIKYVSIRHSTFNYAEKGEEPHGVKNNPSTRNVQLFQPRWGRQIALFLTCCILPFIVAFGHNHVPFLDAACELILQRIYIQDEKWKGVDFENLPEMTTKYDKELEIMDRLLAMRDGGEEEPDDDDEYDEIDNLNTQMNVELTDEERAKLNRELMATAGQSIPNAS